MQVILSVAGTFWHFDLARELENLGYLKRIYSSFPWFRLRREGVSRERVRTFPWIHVPWMASRRYFTLSAGFSRDVQVFNAHLFDRWVAQLIEECDAFVGLSGIGLKTGAVVQRRGGKYVCDRGSSHIRYQSEILQEEYARWGFPGERVDSRMLEREEVEYEQADAITVPSEFARRSFIEKGVRGEKIRTIPYGVRLDRFRSSGEPATGNFTVLFAGTVSIRKGVPYLLDAFTKLKYSSKLLLLAGPVEPEMRSLLPRFDLSKVKLLGRLPQPELAKWMNASHAMVLPSIEDGFGLVMAQAMACGVPVIASENTGGPDLFTNGDEGYVVPVRSSEAIYERLSQLAEDADLQRRMSEASLRRVEKLGGWGEYGRQHASFLKALTAAPI